MLGTLGVVQACFARQKRTTHAFRKLGGKSVLEWIIRRVTDCQRLDGVIVLTDDSPENAFVVSMVPLDVPVFIAERESDCVSRYVAVLDEYSADAVVRVSCDYPFIDPMLVDRLISDADAHPDCDYVTYCSRDGRPAILSSVGLYVEWFRSAALRRVARKATAPADCADISHYLCSHPDKFQLRLIPAPVEIDREDLRLSIDSDEDWEQTLTMFEAFGSDELDWQRIADLLDQQPSLRSQVAALHRSPVGR